MEFNQSVSNPMLVGCFELMKAEDSPEPREDAEGKLSIVPGSQVQFPMLSAGDVG